MTLPWGCPGDSALGSNDGCSVLSSCQEQQLHLWNMCVTSPEGPHFPGGWGSSGQVLLCPGLGELVGASGWVSLAWTSQAGRSGRGALSFHRAPLLTFQLSLRHLGRQESLELEDPNHTQFLLPGNTSGVLAFGVLVLIGGPAYAKRGKPQFWGIAGSPVSWALTVAGSGGASAGQSRRTYLRELFFVGWAGRVGEACGGD